MECPSNVNDTTLSLTINGEVTRVPASCMVAAAVLRTGVVAFRRSVANERRAPLCGMGTCFECRLTIDGVTQSRSCQTPCRDGMVVTTDD